tara:strand:+ start:360 stop:524 length:165 start_codon:yes stop_codon:yes gene_type:complete
MGLIGKSKDVSTDTLNSEELEHLLWAISESTFRGKDVHLLASIVNKLTNQLNSK